MTRRNTKKFAPAENRGATSNQKSEGKVMPDKTNVAEDESLEATQAGKSIGLLSMVAKPQDFADMVDSTMTTLRVGKPKATEFFRVHSEYVVDLTSYDMEVGMEKETYLVTKDVYPQVMDEPGFRQKRYYFYITKAGGLGLWGVSLPDESGKLNSWAKGGHLIAEAAKINWVRAKTDMPNGTYIKVVAKIDLGIPAWPDSTLDDLLETAFKDRIIDSEEHAIIRSLRGEV